MGYFFFPGDPNNADLLEQDMMGGHRGAADPARPEPALLGFGVNLRVATG